MSSTSLAQCGGFDPGRFLHSFVQPVVRAKTNTLAVTTKGRFKTLFIEKRRQIAAGGIGPSPAELARGIWSASSMMPILPWQGQSCTTDSGSQELVLPGFVLHSDDMKQSMPIVGDPNTHKRFLDAQTGYPP